MDIKLIHKRATIGKNGKPSLTACGKDIFATYTNYEKQWKRVNCPECLKYKPNKIKWELN